MKDLSPLGCTRTPNPVSLSSQAIRERAAGFSASTLRAVRVSLSRATRFAAGAVIAQPPAPGRRWTRKDLAPLGWTWTPKPVSLSSQAVHGLSPGVMAWTARLVRVSLLRATRLADSGMKVFVQRVTTMRKPMATLQSAGPRPSSVRTVIPLHHRVNERFLGHGGIVGDRAMCVNTLPNTRNPTRGMPR